MRNWLDKIKRRKVVTEKPKIAVMSYSDDRFGRKGGRYRETQIEMSRMFERHPNIDQVKSFTQDDLTKTPFYRENEKLLGAGITQTAGNMQKPYFIDKMLRSIMEKAYLLYHDASAEDWNFNHDYTQYPLDLHVRMCDENGGILLGTAGQDASYCLHRNYTSPTCMRIMNLDHFKDCVQECASWILLKNTPFIRQLVGEWLKYNTLEDCASYIKTKAADREAEKEFREHRGDQSILTLLLRKYKLTNLMETQNKNVFSIYIPEFSDETSQAHRD